MPIPTKCPCGTDQDFESCCSPILKGKKTAQTAEELLRARYTAFTSHDVDFILDTHHSRTKSEIKREEIEDWAKGSEWLGLKVVQKEGGEAKDNQGTIVFCAQYAVDGKKQDHWEQSFFEKEKGEWKFLDAKGITKTFTRTEPKVGRNDPCSCGSGKKSKKCCGA
jgi:SEC-C motif-containing protein